MRISPSPQPIPADLGGADLVPGSKSHTQRALLLAAFLPGERRIKGALRARDTEVLGRALEAFGARLRWAAGTLLVRGRTGVAPDGDVDLAENASALRMLLAIVPLLGGRISVRVAAGLARRPLAPSLALLAQAGIAPRGPGWPLVVDARRAQWPARLEVDAGLTSQVASGALLGAALRTYWTGSAPRVVVRGAAAPEYVDLTLATLAACGFEVHEAGWAGARELELRLGSRSTLGDFKIPSDASALVFVRALAAMHGLPAPAWLARAGGSGHPDERAADDIGRLVRAAPGARVVLDGLAARPDSVPALAVLAATRPFVTRIEKVAALRAKESDRIKGLARALTRLGVHCVELEDGLEVRGPVPEQSGRAAVPVPADHRVVMAVALLGTLLPDGLEVAHAEAVDKSWPGFWEWLRRSALVEPT